MASTNSIEEYFILPQDLSPEQYIELADEVLEVSSLLFAPLGIARSYDMRDYKQADLTENDPETNQYSGSSVVDGDPKLLTEELQDIWQRTMDSVAEAVYRRHGLSEGTVALSCHKLLEGPFRSEACVNVTNKSQQALSQLIKPPRILELNQIEAGTDPKLEEIQGIALKVQEATRELMGNIPPRASTSTSNRKTSTLSTQPPPSNSLGWSGTYIGTVVSLGFKINNDGEEDGEEAERGNKDDFKKAKPVLAVDTLLGQKIKMRSVCEALNKIRMESMVGRSGGQLEFPELQAYAESLWDAHVSKLADTTTADKAETSSVINEVDTFDQLKAFGDVSRSSVAWKCLSLTNNTEKNNLFNKDYEGCMPSASTRDKNVREEQIQRASALVHAKNASSKLSDLMKGLVSQNLESKCDEALEEADKAISLAWGTAMPFERIASLLCLRAQIRILCADMEMNQAANKKEASMMSWYGGGASTMKVVEQHELNAEKHEENAMRDVSWAKLLCPTANAVRRWNAELELRRAVEILEEQDVVSGGENYEEEGDTRVRMEVLHAEAKHAVNELCRAFVNDGSRDAALAQALEEGARSSTRWQARQNFREQLLNAKASSLNSSDSSLIENVMKTLSLTDKSKTPPLPPTSSTPPPIVPPLEKTRNVADLSPLPPAWLIESFSAGFYIPSLLFFLNLLPAPPSFLAQNKKVKSINDIDESDDEMDAFDESSMHEGQSFLDANGLEWFVGQEDGSDEEEKSAAKRTLDEEMEWDTVNDYLNQWRPRKTPTSSSSPPSSTSNSLRLPSYILRNLSRLTLQHDESVSCQEFSRAQFLSKQAYEVASSEVITRKYNLDFLTDNKTMASQSDAVKTMKESKSKNVLLYQVYECMELLEKEIAGCMLCSCCENEATFAHLTCNFTEAEKKFDTCKAILSQLAAPSCGSSNIKMENFEENSDDDSCLSGWIQKSKLVLKWCETCMLILKEWQVGVGMRCHIKTALALIDGTESSKLKASQAFQSALDLFDKYEVVSDSNTPETFDDEKFVEKLNFSVQKIQLDGDKESSLPLVMQQEKMRDILSISCLCMLSNTIASYLQRGQIKLINNEMELAQEDLEKAKVLSESIFSSQFFQSIDCNPGHTNTSTRADVSWQVKATSTLKRLDAAVVGSLAVCLFKTDLIRNGGAAVMGGMAYGMQRLLRMGENKHPEQGELLLLHGDILSQLGDFAGALKKFKTAAQGCCLFDEKEKSNAFEDEEVKVDVKSDNGLGQTSDNLKKEELKVPVSTSASALPKGCPLPLVNAGRAYLAMNEPILAEKHLIKALEIDPTCASCHLDLGQLRLQGGDVPAALSHFQQARIFSRSFPEFHDAMACEFVAVAHQKAVDELTGGAV